MKNSKSRVLSGYYLPAAILALAMSVGAIATASGQSIRDFVIVSPEPIVQLVQVEQLAPSGNLRFTFRNASSKTILEICISTLQGTQEMVCKSGSTNGTQIPGPSDTFSLIFGASNFPSDAQLEPSPQKSLHVNAVVYTDGSQSGEHEILSEIENRMFGVALETKRISDILSNSQDDSITGLDSVLPTIDTKLPSTSVQAADALKGVSLPGLSQAIVDLHLSMHMQGLLEGVTEARGSALQQINEEKTIAESPLAAGKEQQRSVIEARLHGRSDMAKKYQALNQQQVSYLISFLGGQNAH